MRWNILDRNMHILLSPDTRADASLPIYHDKQIITLQNNCAIGTYDFTVNQQDPDAKTLQLGNYISFVDKYGKTRLYTLMSHDGDEYEQTWHAEDIGLDLINEVADKWKYNEPHSFAWYAENLLLYDSGWSIGINEIGNLTRSLTFDGQSDSVLTRLGDLANQFDGAELDFEVEMSGSAVTKQVINVYKKLGSDLTQQRFVDAVNLKALTTNGSINDLRTAMIGYGSTPDNGGENAEPITFANIEYDDGRYFTLKGDKTVCDRVAGQTWARAGAFDTTNKNALKGYIVGIYTYETKDPNELLKRTITNLKTVNEPQIGYEADLLDLQADIGDTVQIAHRQYNPPIYLSARVQEVENCYTEVGQDTGKLGNYKILESNIDPRITDMVNQVAAKSASYVWVRYADDDKGTNMSILPAGKKYVAVVSVKGNATPSDDPADYAGYWLPLGQDGSNGTPGAPGKDGKTTYNHNAWADDVNGKTGFSTSYADGKLYVGQYSDFTEADSTDPSKYTWARFRGEDGYTPIKGADYFDGKDGQDGKSSYLWIRYSANANGDGMTSDPTGAKYVGYATTQTATAPTSSSAYKWQLVAGKDGIAGEKGTDGKTSYLHIRYSNDGGKTFTANSGENVGTYIGQYTDFTQSDSNSVSDYKWALIKGEKGDTGSDGKPGKDGIGLATTTVTYQESTSGTTRPSGTWSTGVPTLSKGQYLWTRTVWTYTDNTSETGYSVSYIAKDGNNGSNGIAGKDGVGIKSTTITYATSTSGASAPTSGWVSTPPSATAGQFIWTRTIWTYTDNTTETGYSVGKIGEKGATGSTGAPGKPGADGKGIASTTVKYQASTSGTNIPTGTWLASIPAVAANQYLWTRTTWSYTDNTSASGYSVGKMGANGDKGDTGNGIKSVVASYQNSTSGTVIPTGSWVATPPNTPQGQYLWTRNLTTFTNGGTSTSYSVAYSAKDGKKGDKGDPGSKDVPVVTVGTSYPAKPKSGDIHWLTNSSGNVIGYYVYNGSTWVANKIDAKTIAAETFNGLTFNGMTFNGSSFNNAFDFTEYGYRYTGTTTISNASYKTTYLRHNVNKTEPDATGELLINPYMFSNTLYRDNDKSILDNSVQLFDSELQFITNTNKGSGQTIRISRLTSADTYDSGWQKLTFIGGAITDSTNPAKIRRIGKMVYLTGDLKLPPTTGYVWCTIPEEFRPEYESRYTTFAQSNIVYNMIFGVRTNGQIYTIYNSTSSIVYHLAGTNWTVRET